MAGSLQEMVHVPGRLFLCKSGYRGQRAQPFARNERVRLHV